MFKEKFFDFLKYFALVLAAIYILLCIHGVGTVAITEGDKNVMDLSSGWVDENGQEANLAKFYYSEEPQKVYYTFDKVEENCGIIFSARNAYVDVYVDGKLVEEDTRYDSNIFGNSPGTKWHVVSLDQSQKPVALELQVYPCYSNSKGYISNMYYGNNQDIYLKVSGSHMAIFITDTLWILVGTILVIAYILLRQYFKLGLDILYLALGTVFCATWCSAETHMWQFYFGGSRFFHLLGYISLAAVPVSFSLLFAYKLEGKWKLVCEWYSALTQLAFLVTTGLDITGIVEFHYTVKIIHLLLIVLLPFACKVVIGYAKMDKVKRYRKVLYFAFGMLVVCVIVGIVRYGQGHFSDYSSFVRVALFCFLLILFMYQGAAINEVFVKGLESEFQHEMGLLDYLTKFYNRSGYAEHLPEYEKADHNLGIVQFDVNNLKKVNDTMGHEKGDELICLASSGIYQSFNTFGRCYRMGGDEFMVIMDTENLEEDYKTGLSYLNEYCNYANSVEDRSFDVSIAYGFAIKKPGDSINDIRDAADSVMYEKKREMKEKTKIKQNL